ncbi:MAG: hypothetical protein ABH871_07140 [Pseudomonadota bacterium]
MIIQNDSKRRHRSLKGARIDAVLWSLFFIWMGVVLFIKDMPEGVGSLGIGGIVLGGTLLRLMFGASISSFWLIIGAVFILAGIGGLLSIDLPFLPIALLICGMLLLFHNKSERSR